MQEVRFRRLQEVNGRRQEVGRRTYLAQGGVRVGARARARGEGHLAQ